MFNSFFDCLLITSCTFSLIHCYRSETEQSMEKADQEYLDDDDYWDFGRNLGSVIPLDEPARVIHIPISRSKDEDMPSSTFGMDKETMGMEKEISLK